MQLRPTPPAVRRRLAAGALVLVLVGPALVACSDDDSASPAADSTTAAPAAASQGSKAVTLDQLPDIVQTVIPSVVAIRTDTGEGSGVVWDTDGHIVTNNHVITGANTITAVLATGRELDAELVGTDPVTDIALLHVDESDLPAIDQADDVPPVGSPVLAVGNPLGFENSVSFGVVSGVRRSIPGADASLVDLVQTDAAISPGNSGGALVDLDAQLIGVTVAFIPPAERAVSIGFAVPITTVSYVVGQLESSGSVQHAYLGTNLAAVTPELTQEFDLDATEGALVTTVADGSPAAEAGMQAGDVVVGADGQDVSDPEDLVAIIRRSAPGDTVDMQVLKGGQGDPATVSVELAEPP